MLALCANLGLIVYIVVSGRRRRTEQTKLETSFQLQLRGIEETLKVGSYNVHYTCGLTFDDWCVSQ